MPFFIRESSCFFFSNIFSLSFRPWWQGVRRGHPKLLLAYLLLTPLVSFAHAVAAALIAFVMAGVAVGNGGKVVDVVHFNVIFAAVNLGEREED